MSLELLSMLGGGLAGFIFRFMATSMENQQKVTEMVLQKQAAADDSADRAAKRGTHIGRRVLVFTVLWVLAVAPFLGALIGIDTWVESERAPWDFLASSPEAGKSFRALSCYLSFGLLFLPPLVFTLAALPLRRVNNDK